jgi:hypothetical protein
MYRGVQPTRSQFILTMGAKNLARLPRLLAARERERHKAHTSNAPTDKPIPPPSPNDGTAFRLGGYFSDPLDPVATSSLFRPENRRLALAKTEPELQERRRAEHRLRAKSPVAKVARHLGRHGSTISGKIRRNRFVVDELPAPNGDRGVLAQKLRAARRQGRCKLIRLPDPREVVVDRLVGRLVAGTDHAPPRLRRETPAFRSRDDRHPWQQRRRPNKTARPSLAQSAKQTATTPCGTLQRAFSSPYRFIRQRPGHVNTRDASPVERKTGLPVLFHNTDLGSADLTNNPKHVMELQPQPAGRSTHSSGTPGSGSGGSLTRASARDAGSAVRKHRSRRVRPKTRTGKCAANSPGTPSSLCTRTHVKAICERLNGTPVNAKDEEYRQRPSARR